jgi:hypothetical protein
MEKEETVVSRQQRSQHFLEAKIKQATTEEPMEAVFYMWSLLRLYTEDHQQQSIQR